jgi:hypothetical protein
MNVSPGAMTFVMVDSSAKPRCYDTSSARYQEPCMKYVPLVWAAFRSHTTESLLTLVVITIAFTLVGTMVGLKVAYEVRHSRSPRSVSARFRSAGALLS